MGAKVLVGVEIDHRAAAVAKQRFDRVIERSIEEREALGLEPGSFSLIICADVLEHLVDPWSTMRYLRTLAAPDGYLLASIPNVRFYGVLLPLLLWGRFEYGVSGVLDITHLRFFTRPGIDAMLRQPGWLPARWSSDRLGLKRRLVNSLTLGLIRDFLVVQHYVLALPA
jgi:SAM-dependent methyltransferase